MSTEITKTWIDESSMSLKVEPVTRAQWELVDRECPSGLALESGEHNWVKSWHDSIDEHCNRCGKRRPL